MWLPLYPLVGLILRSYHFPFESTSASAAAANGSFFMTYSLTQGLGQPRLLPSKIVESLVVLIEGD
jgi:hypothetical protein